MSDANGTGRMPRRGCRVVLGCAAALLLGGCAGTQHFDLSAGMAAAPAAATGGTAFRFVDARPEGEKDGDDGCTMFEPAVNFYGDESFEPDRMEVLQSTLSRRLGQRLAGQTVTVTEFQVIVFYPEECVRAAGLAAVSVVAALLVDSALSESGASGVAALIKGTVGGRFAFQGKESILVDNARSAWDGDVLVKDKVARATLTAIGRSVHDIAVKLSMSMGPRGRQQPGNRTRNRVRTHRP